MKESKSWNWTKNVDEKWVLPSREIPYLRERWEARNFKDYLDLGSGLGRHSIYMAKAGFRVTSLDLSQEAMDYLKTWSETEGLDINMVVGDMFQIPFEEDSFDCILAYNVTYHTDRKGFKRALAEIRRVLRPGGELMITLISKNSLSYRKADPEMRLDENTIVHGRDQLSQGVPHFYMDLEDLDENFKDWEMALRPQEVYEHLEDPTKAYWTRTWNLLLRKPA